MSSSDTDSSNDVNFPEVRRSARCAAAIGACGPPGPSGEQVGDSHIMARQNIREMIDKSDSDDEGGVFSKNEVKQLPPPDRINLKITEEEEVKTRMVIATASSKRSSRFLPAPFPDFLSRAVLCHSCNTQQIPCACKTQYAQHTRKHTHTVPEVILS